MTRRFSSRFSWLLRFLTIGAAVSIAAPASALDSGIAGRGKGGLLIPRVIVDGIEKYSFSGAEEGVGLWLQYSTDPIRNKASVYVDTLHNAEALYGKYVGYELATINPLSPSSALVYVVLKYERGPLFVRYLVYTYKSTEYIPDIEFSLVPEPFLPGSPTN